MSVEKFKALHEQDTPFIVGNVWDAHTAKAAQDAGFQGLGSSSHAIANVLGYEDGQQISVDEILFVVERIVKSVDIPVSVDFEAGYSSDPEEVAAHVKQLVDVGVVGINLEDGVVKDGKRVLEDSQILARKIKAIKAITNIFINARADTYTTKHADALDESIKRAKLYEESGADGIFLPVIEKQEDIKKVVESISLPLNVFATPNITDYATLTSLGVKRISHGAKLYEKIFKLTQEQLKEIYNKQDFGLLYK